MFPRNAGHGPSGPRAAGQTLRAKPTVIRGRGYLWAAMRKLGVALLILMILFVVADRAAVAIAQHKISDRVASAYDLQARPAVRIRGFPFLTQVLAGRYGAVDVSLGRVVANGVAVSRLDARFTGVRAALGQVLGQGASTVIADHATATALVPLAALRQRLPRGLALRQDGQRLRLSGTVGYLGASFPVSATITPAVSPSGITLSPRDITIGGSVKVPLGAVAGGLGFIVPLGPLPLHLKVTSVSVGPGGLHVTASGQDVRFANHM